ncbi:hypothetical protein M2165_000160 [Variovorax sp. TBS-050B]|nr:hypothetical protein [Variovorax sp. TBS-050B]
MPLRHRKHQPQSKTVAGAESAATRPPVTFEQMRQVRGGDADTFIAHSDRHHLAADMQRAAPTDSNQSKAAASQQLQSLQATPTHAVWHQ